MCRKCQDMVRRVQEAAPYAIRRACVRADIIRPRSIRHRNWAVCSKKARVRVSICPKSPILPTLAGACR